MVKINKSKNGTLNSRGNGVYDIIKIGRNLEEKQLNKDEICPHDVNQVVQIDRDVLYHILRDEMMNSLLTELGINDFNKWHIETIGGKAPFLYVKPKGNPMKRRTLYLEDIKKELRNF